MSGLWRTIASSAPRQPGLACKSTGSLTHWLTTWLTRPVGSGGAPDQPRFAITGGKVLIRSQLIGWNSQGRRGKTELGPVVQVQDGEKEGTG